MFHQNCYLDFLNYAGILIILFDRKFFKNWQAKTSDVDLYLYGEHMPEETITGSKIDLD